MNYRNKKLTQSAKHERCVSCGADDGTIVWAHSNHYRHGKGKGLKAHDLFGAYLCWNCHKNYDETSLAVFMAVNEFAKTKQEWFIEMWERSMIIACNKGHL